MEMFPRYFWLLGDFCEAQPVLALTRYLSFKMSDSMAMKSGDTADKALVAPI
jgi:hypothetical protein